MGNQHELLRPRELSIDRRQAWYELWMRADADGKPPTLMELVPFLWNLAAMPRGRSPLPPSMHDTAVRLALRLTKATDHHPLEVEEPTRVPRTLVPALRSAVAVLHGLGVLRSSGGDAAAVVDVFRSRLL